MFYTSTEYNALVIICHHIGIVKEKVLCRYNMPIFIDKLNTHLIFRKDVSEFLFYRPIYTHKIATIVFNRQ